MQARQLDLPSLAASDLTPDDAPPSRSVSFGAASAVPGEPIPSRPGVPARGVPAGGRWEATAGGGGGSDAYRHDRLVVACVRQVRRELARLCTAQTPHQVLGVVRHVCAQAAPTSVDEALCLLRVSAGRDAVAYLHFAHGALVAREGWPNASRVRWGAAAMLALAADVVREIAAADPELYHLLADGEDVSDEQLAAACWLSRAGDEDNEENEDDG